MLTPSLSLFSSQKCLPKGVSNQYTNHSFSESLTHATCVLETLNPAPFTCSVCSRCDWCFYSDFPLRLH